MPYVKRDEKGKLVAISEQASPDFNELLDESDPELLLFIERIRSGMGELQHSDFEIIRVIEDVVNVLLEKNIILFTDLPIAAQEKIKTREALRGRSFKRLNLLGEDHDKI